MARIRLFLPLLVFVALALLLWRALDLDPNYMPSALVDQPLPVFRLPTLEGAETSEKELQGTPMLLNVWATWCPSCAAEHAYLNTLAAQGVTIVGINYKDEDEAARAWLAQRGNPYRASIVDRDGRLGIDLGVTGAPETYLVDAAGVVRLRHQGPVDEQIWRTLFEPEWRKLQAGDGS